MDLWEFILRWPDFGQLVEAAIKYWRVTVSVLAAIGVIIVVCLYWDSMAVRLIAGFHILVAFTTAGALWETNRPVTRRGR